MTISLHQRLGGDQGPANWPGWIVPGTISLHQRLGGNEGIAHLVDDVIAAHLANPLVTSRFAQIKDMTHTRQLVGEFFAAGLGTPPTYTGKGMLGAHKDANVSEQEFQAAINDIDGAMDKNGIDEGSKNDILAIL